VTQAMYLILIIEDDAGIRSILRTLLEAQNYRVVEAANGARGVLEARIHRPDLAIVDLGLPDQDGQTVIREIRAFSPVPIVVLSARTMEQDKVAALDGGADDYVAKPFSAPELLARVRAAFRRAARVGTQLPVLHLGAIAVNLATRTVLSADRTLHLTPLEFRLLECLARGSGMIVTQTQLISEVWGPDKLGDSRGLRSYIKQLRQKVETDPRQPRFLLTEAGVGYRLIVDDAATLI
jgi:two-component system, OmpR family, KDP operon response regulator KdpE